MTEKLSKIIGDFPGNGKAKKPKPKLCRVCITAGPWLATMLPVWKARSICISKQINRLAEIGADTERTEILK